MIVQLVGQAMALGEYAGKKGKVSTLEVYVSGENGTRGDLVRMNLPENLGPEKVQAHLATRVSIKADLFFFDNRPGWTLRGIQKA